MAVCQRTTFTGASNAGPYYQIWSYGRTSWPEWNPVFGRQITGLASKFQVTPTTEVGGNCDPRLASPPRGPVRVSVQPPPTRPEPRARQPPAADANLGPKPAAPPPEAAPGFVRLPAKYADPGQSGLTFELKDADQDYSLDLK